MPAVKTNSANSSQPRQRSTPSWWPTTASPATRAALTLAATPRALAAPQHAAPRKQRLAPADRERQIIEGAIAYFSEVGFSGQTRELSSRLGITQPLLYRYFANKQALVERVYETVFEGRWNPAWIDLLQDRSLPLRDRLVAFYHQYSQATYRPEWIRIYMHAGLSDPTLNRRYIQLVRRRLMPVYCRELRRYCGLADTAAAVAEAEVEFVWTLHGGIFYLALRQHVYRMRVGIDFMTHVGFAVDNFLAGALSVYPRLLAAHVPAALAGVPSPREPPGKRPPKPPSKPLRKRPRELSQEAPIKAPQARGR